jgi:hypothetical protein
MPVAWRGAAWRAGNGHGQSGVRNVHGWGYGRFVTVEEAEDVLTFSGLR